MLRARTNHTSAILNGEIYVIGVDAVEVERYDPYNKSWCAISPALKYVSNFAAASCSGKLYLVGSCAVKYNALTLQCYNPVQDLWSVITSPFIPKYLSAPRCATLRGLIYLIGDNTKKVHVYDPEANIWQKVVGRGSTLPGRWGWCSHLLPLSASTPLIPGLQHHLQS
uniref:Kelch-like protein 1 n=1 Tax=Malurus cyaneus samueli TaxID=2593467 RepID=A0A8C5X2T1_9PASS